MSDWDRFDDELAGALRRRAGSSGDPLATDSAHRAVLARATGIRRRRAAIAGGGTLTVLLVAGLAVLTTGGDDDLAVAPADTSLPGSSAPSIAVSTPNTIDVTYQPAPSTSRPAVTTTVAPETVATTPTTVTTTTVSPETTTVPDTTPTTTASADTPPGRYPYSSSGGSIIVDYDGAALTLVSYQAVEGYTAAVEDQQADRIRVRFENDATGGDSRIDCRIENGRISADIQ
jgi:hypothetical protein